jgi:two-component system, NarL family, response regulator NreC
VPRPRIVLADDYAAFIDIARDLLSGHCDVVAAVADGPSLVASADALRPDLIVTDLSMPGFNGLEAIRRLRARHVPAKVIILSLHADPVLVSEALCVGAQGYVLKQNVYRELVGAVRCVSRGLTYITPLLRTM